MTLATSTTSAPRYPLDPSWPPENPVFEAAFLDLVNAHRRSIGVQTLRVGKVLTGIAVWKARQMAAVGYLAHDDQDTPGHVFRSIGERFTDLGYPVTAAWGENAAYAFADPQLLLNAYLSDVGHKANIENPSWIYVGTGCAVLTNAQFPAGLPFHAQDFGTWDGTVVVDPPPPPPPPPVTPPPASGPPTAGEVWVNNKSGKHAHVLSVAGTHLSYAAVKANGKLGVVQATTVHAFTLRFHRP